MICIQIYGLEREIINLDLKLIIRDCMKTLLLIDGNSMVFRAFYATMRQAMTSKSGQPTNAVFGFSNMLFKAMELINPDYVFVAFDTGAKTYRHEMYEDYKATRKALPEELISQFPLVREFLDAVPMVRYEKEGYEADDLIGSMVHRHPELRNVILTSDRDMLQLINSNTTVLLMKKGITEMEEVDLELLEKEYQLRPDQVIDLKGLMGDSADNIPGIPGVGEKTAQKLLNEYDTLENIYQNTDKLKGKLKERIIENKELAYFSKELATIHTECEIDLDLDELTNQYDPQLLARFYRKYDMNSLLRRIESDVDLFNQQDSENAAYYSLDLFDQSWLQDDLILMADVKEGMGYHALIEGFYIGDFSGRVTYLSLEEAGEDFNFKQAIEGNYSKHLVNGKETYHGLYRLGLEPDAIVNDVLVLAYLVDSNITTLDKLKDAFDLWNTSSNPHDAAIHLIKNCVSLIPSLKKQAHQNELDELYETIELPLVEVLVKMEIEGIDTDLEMLVEFADKTYEKIEKLTEKIHAQVGREFNINSPKQLSEVLFDELRLPANRKRSTAVDILEGLVEYHPIINDILDYRKLTKFHGTYASGLQRFVGVDGKIHSTFSQTTAATGRLSSLEPNLQNISIRDEMSKEIRKAFVALEGFKLLAVDYSQIELRVLAHLADEEHMIEAFNKGHDIHSETAIQLFDLGGAKVTSDMRRKAKAVNFGIIYGISDYGLSQQIQTSPKEANAFITKYLETFSGVKTYMDEVVKYCEEHGYVKTLFNRRRYLPEINASNFARKQAARRAAMNAPIQGSAADLMKIAMIKISDNLEKQRLKSKLILQIHDEVIVKVADDEREIVTQLVVEAMENVAQLKVALDVEATLGQNLYEV